MYLLHRILPVLLFEGNDGVFGAFGKSLRGRSRLTAF